MSCLTGKELGRSLIETGSYAFIGYSVEAEALLGSYTSFSLQFHLLDKQAHTSCIQL